MDAAEAGVGALLSQRFGKKPKLQPVAFFTQKKADHNYDIGSRELLAVKVALEEWHHWLEGLHTHSSYTWTKRTCHVTAV